jgi:acyl-CoA dehydrogenase
MCVTDARGEADVHRRASMFVVPTGTRGMTLLREVGSMGEEPVHAYLRFEDCRIPAENLLGAEGEGFAIAQSRLGPGRIHHCMRWIGQMRRAFDMLCERAASRETRDGHLADEQTIQNWIADSWAEMNAARLLTLHAAWKIDCDGVAAARNEIAAIKYYGAGVLHDVVDRAVQIHGALGLSEDMPLESMYRRARAARIYDGPDEVHRVAVARRLLRAVPPHPGVWPSEHIPTRRTAARLALGALADEFD